ncbi:MAG: hypothetical protein AB1416_08490 [Actinomycetota bacterium]
MTEGDVRRAGRDGCVTADALVERFGLDDAACCGRCVREVDRFVQIARQPEGRRPLRVPVLPQPALPQPLPAPV